MNPNPMTTMVPAREARINSFRKPKIIGNILNFSLNWIKYFFDRSVLLAGKPDEQSEDDLNLPQGFGKGQPADGCSPENGSPLLLVGTAHRDPGGKSKLLTLLDKEKPAFITVEISPYARSFRRRKGTAFRAMLRQNLQKIHKEEKIPWREILSDGAIQGIFFLLKEPYEWMAAEVYAKATGAVLEEVDLSRYSAEKLSRVPELVSEKNLRFLLRSSSPGMSEQAAAQYRRARALFSRPPSVWPQSPEERERENFMAGRIRRIFQRAGGRKVAHVGGWEHLVEFSGGATLLGLLLDLRPRRVLLSGQAGSENPGRLVYPQNL